LALKFIGARTARKQQNDVGALEGFRIQQVIFKSNFIWFFSLKHDAEQCF
jgi:hypothetical protein